ncbi:MAG: hypothetical protein KAG84_03370 [Bacteroidales bacterium]|nr:hypothetical protein [Bacteroidales bacterium]
MEKHILSKTSYIKGDQCLKQLFLSKKNPKLRDRLPAERLAIFSRGTKVGIYAQELFPGGIDAGPKHYTQYQKSVAYTKELMENGQEVIYEAAFQANKTLILLDVLVKNGEKWDAYEVKSSLALSDTYYKDASLQYSVLLNSGVDINRFSLVHINKDYVREGAIDNNKLFVITDVTDIVSEQQNNVERKITEQIEILELNEVPLVDVGKHCYNPYDCDFIGHCWKGIKTPSVFDIPSIGFDMQLDFYNKHKSLESIIENCNTIDEFQTTEILCQLEKNPHLELSEDTMFDFEEVYNSSLDKYAVKILYFKAALPLYDGLKPYQKIAFAYSIMPIDGKGAANYFIANGDENPHKEIMDKLTDETNNKTLIGYNCYDDDIEIYDLQQVVDNGEYYHPAMKKDYSNKSLSIAMGNRAQWGSIESDIVAAQYYDEILRGHKKSDEKLEKIKKYLMNELELVAQFFDYLSQ